MQKKDKPQVDPTPSPWDETPVDPGVEQAKPQVKYEVKPKADHVVADSQDHGEYDLDGLMTDFPTATELERFVYDQTGIVLNLKGRANKLKYQIGMDVLNGHPVESKYLGSENPYVDKAEMIPVEPLKPVPERSADLPDESELQNTFVSNFIPHPDTDYRARDVKVQCVFRKYKNGMISYDVLGPIDPKPIGEKMDKFGKLRPEIMAWVDPRTGEQTIVRSDGTMTPQGRKLRALMQTFKVNRTNQWEVWIDREFISLDSGELRNPWDVT